MGTDANRRPDRCARGRARDFFWPAHDLAVEADWYAWHSSPDAQATRRRAYVAGAILRALGR